MGIWDGMDFWNGFEGLIFKESFFIDWFEKEDVDKRADNFLAEFVQVLVGEDLGEQGESLLGIVASEILNLLDDMFMEFGE